jgi:outer membrane protein assembly complex protein YaeT
MTYENASLSRSQKARVRKVWHAGISNHQRPIAAKDAILNYFAEKGYLHAEVTPEVLGGNNHKEVRFELQPGTRYRGLKIDVEGADSDRARDIEALLKQRQLRLSAYRGTRPVSEAIMRYYEQRGYLEAKVGAPAQKLDAERRTGRIVIPVEEGPVFRVGAIEFSGNTALTSEILQQSLVLQKGQVFEWARLQPALAALKQKYGELGFGQANIQYDVERQDDRASVDVSFTIVENQQTSIGRIIVEGNRRTTEDFARSQLTVGEDEIANATLIRQSSKNLAQTGAYTSTDIRLQPPVEAGASDKRVQVADMVVNVIEPKPFRLLYGGLYDSGGGPGFIADFQNHNWLGGGRVLGLRTRADPETDDFRLYMTKPFWRQLRLSTTIAVYLTRETKNYQTTPTETLGASIQQDLPLRSKWLMSYGYRFERQRGFVPDPAAPDVKSNVVNVAPATFTISRDSRDSFLDATTGSFISHGFEFAPRFLGSDYPYLRWYGQYFKYFPLTRPAPVPFGEQPKRSRLVFATGSRLGLQKGFSPEGAVLTNRFYAGGGTTVRGFGQDELGPKLPDGQPAGGNAVLVLNEELRYPLYGFLDAVTFVDIGNVFPRVSDFRFSDLRSTGGFGLRVRNPFVVLRFDYGFKFSRLPGEKIGAFFFSIGQAF